MSCLNPKQCKMDENNAFYVGVSDPVQLRRLLLECSKQILQSLQDYETLQSIREEKIRLIIDLRHTVKEIYTLNSKLNSVVPKTQLRDSREERPELEIPSSGKRHKELESFEDELGKIEEKLSLLGA